MASIEVRDILELAQLGPDRATVELSKLYEWRHEWLSTGAKAVVGAGASLLVALLAAAIEHDYKVSKVAMLFGGLGALLVLAVGIAMFLRTRRIYREYVTAQVVLGQALEVSTFLGRYARTK